MGTKLFILFLLFFPVANAVEWPRPSSLNCEFYTKLESEFNCKGEGVTYLSQYAPFYCEAFRTKSMVWKTPLKEWAQETGVCLQEMLYEHRKNPNFNCQNLEAVALKTHTACYKEAEMCQLKLKDIAEIFKVIRIKDLFKEIQYSYAEVYKLSKTCLAKWISE